MKLHDKSLLGRRVYGFNTYRRADSIEIIEEPNEEPNPFPEARSPKESLLDSIFSVSPLTKLPDGDIAVFLNKNTSDSVRKFIQDNLLSDNGGISDTSKYGDLPDSVIADYTRSSDETVYQYRDRIIGILRANAKNFKGSKDKDDKS